MKRFLHTSNVTVREIADNIMELAPFPEYSVLLNERHFFQNSILLDWSRKSPHPVSLKQLSGFGRRLTREKILTSANFARMEIPIRMAIRIKDLQHLPFGVVNNFHLVQVYESYYHCFNKFRKFPKIESLDDNDRFCEFVRKMLNDHLLILPHLMMGSLECSISQSLSQAELDHFMSLMLRSRISRRVIMEQHLALTNNYITDPFSSKPPDFIGDVFDACSAVETIRKVGQMVSSHLQSLHPNVEMPKLIIEGHDAKFPFMMTHLNYIMGELLRNAYKATIDCHLQRKQQSSIPPITVSVSESKRDVTFRFSDLGGGVDQPTLDNLWSFNKSPQFARKSLSNFHRLPGLDITPRFPVLDNSPHTSDPSAMISLPDLSAEMMQSKGSLNSLIQRPFEYSLGISLPMSKIYTDYWNGDLQLHSMKGYGSDVFLRLSKLGGVHEKLQLDRA